MVGRYCALPRLPSERDAEPMLLERRAYCQSLIAAAMERWVRRDVGVPTGPAISLAHSGAEAVFNVRDYGALGKSFLTRKWASTTSGARSNAS